VTTYTNTPHPSFSADLEKKRKDVLVRIKFEGFVRIIKFVPRPLLDKNEE